MQGAEVKIVQGSCTYLVASEFAKDFDPAWFQASHWGSKATAVGSGGRGSAWFIDDGEQQWVLRHYLRGGMAAKLSKQSYFFLGEDKVRSFGEFRLLLQLSQAGLPVPSPIAATYRREGTAYRSAILMRRLLNVQPLGVIGLKLPESGWKSIGLAIRKLHDYGVFHADLNCFNVLVGESQIYLIDFDKAYIKSKKRSGFTSWKRKNIQRLYRSLLKNYTDSAERESLNFRWEKFLSAYHQETM